MGWLRSTWGARGVGTLVLAGLLGASLTSTIPPSRYASSYAEWVRTQFRGPIDEAVEQALADASSDRPRSLDAFLTAFVRAYEAREPGATVARSLFALDLSDEALITYLESRYHGVVSDAVLPRAVLVATSLVSSHLSNRLTALGAPDARRDLPVWRVFAAWRIAWRGVVVPLRVVSAAQPLGP